MAKEVVEIPMAGKILHVGFKVGDVVQEDDVLCILESMKMENPIVATASGRVVEVGVKDGDTVDAGQTLAVIEY